jgi:hypothetical protein
VIHRAPQAVLLLNHHVAQFLLDRTEPGCDARRARTDDHDVVINYSLQAIGTKLYSPRDSNVWSVSVAIADTSDSWLVAYNNVTHLGDRWSIEPAVRFYSQSDVTQVKLVRIQPGVRLSYRPTLGSSLELDGLWERSKTTAPDSSDTTTRYFYSLGYRLDL